MATPDVATMRRLKAHGKAMAPLEPGGRPRFNIASADDPDNAIKAVGRVAPEGRPAVRKFIMKRARALGLASKIPDTWLSSGELKTSG